MLLYLDILLPAQRKLWPLLLRDIPKDFLYSMAERQSPFNSVIVNPLF